MIRAYRYFFFAALTTLCTHSADAAWFWGKKKAPPKLLATSQVVQDLYYGDVLFYFYQDDYFEALTRVDAALQLGRVEHHQIESKLLRGALYLSMGEHVEAGKIFKELLNDNVPDNVRNRAWFYLAKVWYQRGYYSDAEVALNSIAGKLTGGLESERQLLHAEVLMGQDRFDDAINVLNGLPKSDPYAPYAHFNLGVALMRQQRPDDAVRMLEEVGQMRAPTEELAALRDKANLALGFAWLKADRPQEAAQALARVRLQGPQTTKALLGAGWAAANEKRFNAALAPWLELHGRNMLDAAVQESYLAVPYAYAQLSATGKAAEEYAQAIEAFNDESARIEQSIQAISAGRLLDAILEHDSADEVGWYWQLKQLPDAPETRYLFHLLATHEFQEGLKNYRDLKLMQRRLASGALEAEAFQNMIDTKRAAFAQRLPVIDATMSKVDFDGLESRKLDVGTRLAVSERDEDVTGLATAHEAEQWRKVQALEQALASADPNDSATEEMREKLRMIKGVLYWEMNASYKARLWHARKEQRELEVAVKEARRRGTLIERARQESPERTEEFAVRVATLQPRIEEMTGRLQKAADAQNQYLAAVAIKELRAQQERLASYGLQAQYALASILDKAANGTSSSSTSAVEGSSPVPPSTGGATP
jgi:Tetratricopeptide repeat